VAGDGVARQKPEVEPISGRPWYGAAAVNVPRTRSPATVAYLAIAALATLASARLFYSAMLAQTGGEWSAPLDDVFIHFDYARATARGYPFQWTEGNGFSSGGTSALYPFVLAFGFWIGFRGPSLMIWAAVVAAISVFGFLWGAARLFTGLSRASQLLAPLCLFSVGALAWTLWSGMEGALVLGLWGGALAVALDFRDRRLAMPGRAWLLGAIGALLVATRPEAVTSVAVLGVAVAWLAGRRLGGGRGLSLALRAVLPGALVIAAQTTANRLFTGESSAAGAVVKLALHNPYMTSEQKLADYLFNLHYSFDRLRNHHFGELGDYGHIPFLLGLVPFLDRRSRGAAAILWASGLLWVALVAANGQVRWQNERYLMPAVAWLLLAAALGLGVLFFPVEGRLRWIRGLVGAAVAVVAMVLFWRGERVQYRDQVWFFARASRNIRDQHTTVGKLLRAMDPPPRRVMVGDAGAIVYAADLPAFDLIGLGGYRGLPLARASVHGVGATLELLERVPKDDRPDVMAIYPTWWPALPHWFGDPIFSVPVSGNVICGGAEKVVYRARWSLLGTGAKPRSITAATRIFDEVDVGDLVSENAHGYVFPSPEGGFIDMRVLPDEAKEGDLWDAGRRIPSGRPESFQLRHLPAGSAVKLIFRTAIDADASIAVDVGSFHMDLALTRAAGFREPAVVLPASAVAGEITVRVTPRGEWTNYHVWAVEPLPERGEAHRESPRSSSCL
jgi:hypothetical protein